jgi:methionine synthase II (cobalamin-independent)
VSDPLSALVLPGPDDAGRGPDAGPGSGPESDPGSGPAPGALQPEERATGLGSLPGTDRREAARTVVGELPDFPHLPELPARGVGADVIGRAAALLVDLAFDEALGETGAAPRRVKTQVAGPWTLAAGVELRSGNRVLTDTGAVAEFTESLAEGLRGHITDLGRRTGAGVVVQIDEPTLPAVLAGSLPTPSGFGTVRAVSGAEARTGLATLVAAARDAGAVGVVVHCCHPTPPLALLGATGADAVAVDLTALVRSTGDGPQRSSTISSAVLDALGELWDGGIELWLGLVPSTDPAARPELEALARPSLELADRLGFDRERLADRAVVTPTCGLAGASPAWARTAMARSVELARALADPPSAW